MSEQAEQTQTTEQEPQERGLTFGELLCGTNFNPSNNQTVSQVKQTFAALANFSYDIFDQAQDGIHAQIANTAITKILDAQMWLVKAITYHEVVKQKQEPEQTETKPE